MPVAAVVLLAMLMLACGAPRDPEKTLERVQKQHVMRVGLVESPPWVIRTGGEPAGVEPELARRFARTLGATPQWFWGADQPHMEALERFELDLVVADLDAKSPWNKKVGLTRPYFKEQVAVGVPPGANPPSSLDGLNVAVEPGDVTAAYVGKQGALATPQTDLSHAAGPAAAPTWRLQQLGFTLTKFQLFEKQHVMAVPPGENAWLKKLTEFLFAQQQNIRPLLQSSEAPQ